MDNSLEIVEIKSISDYKKFVNFQFELYSNNPFWVPPIINEEVYTINPNKNPVYNNSIAKFFLAYKNGKIVGRIAAIINWLEVKKINKKVKTVGYVHSTQPYPIHLNLLLCLPVSRIPEMNPHQQFP